MKHWPGEWFASGLTRNVTFLELFPIIVALHLWGASLANTKVVFTSDSMSVVMAINNQGAKCLFVLRLLKTLIRLCLLHKVHFSAKHVPGVDNAVADALSRSKLADFRARWPQADELMAEFPVELWRLGVPLPQT